MTPRRRCSRLPADRGDLSPHHLPYATLDYLGPDGPLHPDRTPLRTAEDACDALDLSRPPALVDGIVVLLLDETVRPYLAIAVNHAPPDDIDRLAALLGGTRDLGHPIAGVVLGVFRPTRCVGSTDLELSVDGAELAAWVSLSRLLHGLAITLVDVLVFEPGRWMSLVAATSVDTYPRGPLPWLAGLD